MSQAPTPKVSRFVWTWKGKTYVMPFTANDALKLARAIQFEGPPSASVAWTLIQRACWLWTNGNKVGLGKLVEQYAQPINPAWFPYGAKHLAEMERLKRLGDLTGAASEAVKSSKRVEKANISWSKLADDTKELLLSILAGYSSSPLVGSVHYWMSRGPTFQINQDIRPVFNLIDTGSWTKTNVFFAEKGSEAFGGIKVVDGMLAYPGGAPPAGGNGAIKALACLVGGYLSWRYL